LKQPPLKVGFAHFAGCSGCQLMLLNCEPELPTLAGMVSCSGADMLTSQRDDRTHFDLLLIEGAIASSTQREELRALRNRSARLAAVGECALTGGINRFETPSREAAAGYVYGSKAENVEILPALPVERFVEVDFRIPGCPPERRDFLDLFGALRYGGWPLQRQAPVCMECRIRENRCLLQEDRLPCLGPITRGGCLARCPSINVACEGCRGEVAEANRDELGCLLAETAPDDLRRRMQRFGGGKA